MVSQEIYTVKYSNVILMEKAITYRLETTKTYRRPRTIDGAPISSSFQPALKNDNRTFEGNNTETELRSYSMGHEMNEKKVNRRSTPVRIQNGYYSLPRMRSKSVIIPSNYVMTRRNSGQGYRVRSSRLSKIKRHNSSIIIRRNEVRVAY